MGKLRSINTALWSDPFIEDLTVSEKLLFIYLITNEKTNMLGIYESSVKKISFETGIDKGTVEKALEGFERVKKVKRVGNYIILLNFLKHQNFNTNMKKSAIDAYYNLPEHLKTEGFKPDRNNPLKAFESLSNHLGILRKEEVEYEVEEEVELETELEFINGQNKNLTLYENPKLTFNDFWSIWPKKVAKAVSEKAWNSLKEKEKEDALNHVPKYIAAKNKTTEAIPHASTYLNQKRFYDEDLPEPAKLVQEKTNYGKIPIDQFFKNLAKPIDDKNLLE